MAWTAPEITRELKPLGTMTGDERTLVDEWLDVHGSSGGAGRAAAKRSTRV